MPMLLQLSPERDEWLHVPPATDNLYDNVQRRNI
jgi:hypothetical protein